MILWALWRRGLLRRLDREKTAFFLGVGARSPRRCRDVTRLWRRLGLLHMMVSPAYAAGVARWLEYRMNLFDGIEG